MTNNLSILIVDDNEMMVKTLGDILRVKGYNVEAAHSGSEALETLVDRSFDCILSDIKMPELNGVDLYRAIKTHHPDVPVILMTAYATDKLIEEGLKEGVISVLTKPLNMNLLLNFLNYLRLERSVVIVDDDPDFCKTLSDILQERGFKVDQIVNPADVVDNLDGDGQVVLLDMKLQNTDGLEVMREIRNQYPTLPVILVTGYRNEVSSAIETALEMSAHTYFYKPLQIDSLIQTLNQIHHQELGRILGRIPTKMV